MSQNVQIATLRSEMERHGWRDLWRIARNGRIIERRMSLALIEEMLHWDPTAKFSIRHSNEPLELVEHWLVLASQESAPKPARTDHVRQKKPKWRPPVEAESSANKQLERRVADCERHYDSIMGKVQRLMLEMAELREFGTMQEDLDGIHEEIVDLQNHVKRNQFCLSGIRIEAIGAA